MPRANETHFRFYCGGLDRSLFRVASFSGTERISSPYRFDLSLISSDDQIRHDDIVGMPATLLIASGQNYLPYSGIVSEFRIIDKNTDYCVYGAVLVPRLWLAGLNQQSRIFQKMSIPEIVKAVLDEYRIGNYRIRVSNMPEQEFVVQYAESDLNFISRLMESAGVWFLFRQDPVPQYNEETEVAGEELIVTDDPAEFGVVENEDVLFKPLSGLDKSDNFEQFESILSLSSTKQAVAGKVLVRNYNYRNPEVELTGKRDIEGGKGGTFYQYGGFGRKSDEVQRSADVLSRRIKTQQIVLNGTGNKRGFRAGLRFTLKEHHRADFNVPYLLTCVKHSGGHQNGNDTPVYSNEFSCIPGERAGEFAPEIKADIPRVNGILTGIVESNDPEYACIDEMGRYKIRFPFDVSERKNDCSGSKYIRLAQPNSGPQYGIHFPARQGTEMVLACIDGDPSKPLGLGTIPNANTVSPVVSTNKQQNIIRSAGGNEILLDDTDGKQRVRIMTKKSFCLEMDDENDRVLIRTSEKSHIVFDEKNKTVSLTCGENTIVIGNGDNGDFASISTAGGHVIRADDKSKRVTLQSGEGLSVDLDDSSGKITLQNKQSTISLEKSGIVLDTGGKISLKAGGNIEVSGTGLSLKSSSGEIELNAAQALKESGLSIEQKAATSLKLDALQIEGKASGGLKMGGMTVEVKGDVSLKAGGGVSAELSAGGITTVKGGIVMVN